MMSEPELILSRLTLIVAAVIVVLAPANAASEADHATMGLYASTMTNAIPTLSRGQEEMEKDCGSLSGPSGVKDCVHGLRIRRRQCSEPCKAACPILKFRIVSGMSMPSCAAHSVSYRTVIRKPKKAWSRGCRRAPSCPSRTWMSCIQECAI